MRAEHISDFQAQMLRVKNLIIARPIAETLRGCQKSCPAKSLLQVIKKAPLKARLSDFYLKA